MLLLVACGDTDTTNEDQNEALKAEIDELKEELDTLKANATDVSSETIETASTEEAVIGEWFNYGEFDGATHQINFNAEGTGDILTSEYDWHDTTIRNDDPNYTGEYIHKFKWSFENGIVKIVYENENEDKLDLKFVES